MGKLQARIDADLRRVYAGELEEKATIDEREIPGGLNLSPSPLQLMEGGWNEQVTAIFSTLKSYWPSAETWPKPMRSKASVVVAGAARTFQVKAVQGDKDTRAQLLIGFGSFEA